MMINVEEEIINMLMNKYGWSEENIMKAENFDELGLDSLSIYSLVTECEEKFNVKIDTDDITEINSPMKFIRYIKKGVDNGCI